MGCVEVSNQSKKLHFSPLLGIILTTTTVWVAEKPIRGQNVSSMASFSDQETPGNFYDTLTSEMSSDDTSEAVEPYPKVSIMEEGISSERNPETATESPGNTPQEQASLEFSNNISSDPWSDDDSEAVEPYPKVSIMEEAIAAEATTKQETEEDTTPTAQPETEDIEVEEKPAPLETPIPQEGQTPETQETETTGEEPRVLVVEVQVEGADEELEDLIYNTVQTRPGRTATRSQLQEDVNAIYATGYFANVEVTPADTPLGVRITYSVKVNPVLEQVVVNTVPDIEERRALPPETVQEIFGQQYGQTLNLRDLQDGIKEVNEWYAEQGFDLAQVIGSPEVSEDGIVTLIIAEGVIENIEVRFFDPDDEPLEGRTRDFIVTREMQLKPGNVFNRKTAQFDLQRIFGLGLFEDVRISFSPGEDPREVIVNVDVVEGNTGSLAAGTGISSSSGLFGTISYQEQNLGGNGQTIGGEVQVGERELLLDVNFTDPWIAGDPFRTAYTVNGFRRRTISLVFDGDDSSIRTLNGFDSPRVIRTGGGISFARPLAEDPFTKPDWRLTAGFNYQRVQIENADGDIAPLSAPLNGFPEQPLSFSDSGRDDLFTLTFAAAQDFRNNPLRPTSGYVVRLGLEQTIPVGSGSIGFTRLRGNYSYYIPVDFIDLGFIEEDQPKPQAFAFNVQAGTVFEDLPPYEAFVIGGSNSVRGYAEGELGNGRSYFQATAEYRFPIIPAVGAALFIDYGTTIKSQRSVRGIPGVVRQLPSDGYGYGIGVRIQSPVGPIRVDYGINDEGDSRIHFGIGERF